MRYLDDFPQLTIDPHTGGGGYRHPSDIQCPRGKTSPKTGYFPSNYIQKCNPPNFFRVLSVTIDGNTPFFLGFHAPEGGEGGCTKKRETVPVSLKEAIKQTVFEKLCAEMCLINGF